MSDWQKFLVMLMRYSRCGLPEVKEPEKESEYRRYAKWATVVIFAIFMIPVVLFMTSGAP